MDDLFTPLVDAFEPNDSRATAVDIDEGSHDVSGNGIDWFAVDMQAGIVDLTMTPVGDLQTLNMEFYNPFGQVTATSFTPSGAEHIHFAAKFGGTYFIKVYAARYVDDPPDDLRMDYRLDVDLPTPILPDGNDSRATADPLGEGHHDIVGTGIDWFRLSSLSGPLRIGLTGAELLEPGDPRDDPRNLNVELYDASGRFLAANLNATSSETIDTLAPADGAYYLKVYAAQYPTAPPEDLVLSYRLDVDLPAADPPDPNGSMATATPIGAGHRSVEGWGTDWFRFASGPGIVDVTMTPTTPTTGPEVELNARLFDAEGNPLASNFVQGGPEALRFDAPVSGTWYLKVFAPAYPDGAPNGVRLSYDLDIDLPQRTWSRGLDFGPVNTTSVAVYDIDNDGRDEIFVGTSKELDAQANEVLPGGLVVLEDDGRVKWTHSFPAIDGADAITGKSYRTSAVSTAPTFSDLDDDGRVDLVVGIGATNSGFGTVSQPGDRGGVYALDADGGVMWSFTTRNTFGGDNRPEGVYSAPRVYDIDGDGVREVMFTSWDHWFYVLDGRTGALEREVNLHDTAGATPAVADLDNDGFPELVVPADISANARAGLPTQGGILHVLSGYGQQNVPGWDQQVGTSTAPAYRGKFEEQSLWSSPQIVDLDGDGRVEIVQGTGDFFKDGRGEYFKVWNADGSLRFRFDTEGRVLANPLIADLDGSGRPEIVVATPAGHVYGVDARGRQLFDSQVMPFGATGELPILRSPVAVDVDDSGDLEIMVSIGTQMVMLDSNGRQLSGVDAPERVFIAYGGSPVVSDIDHDGRLDLLAAGSHDGQTTVFRWENPVDVTADSYRSANYQGNQSLHEIRAFVERFYNVILDRDSDPRGSNNWTDDLYSGVRSGADVARGFIFSPEYRLKHTSDADFVHTLYAAFFDREPDAGGYKVWMNQLAQGAGRDAVVEGFIDSREFANLANSFGIRADDATVSGLDAGDIAGDGADAAADILRGGDGANDLHDGVLQESAAGKTFNSQVYRLYGAALGREPDPRGLGGWVGLLETGAPLVNVANALISSAEFQKNYGALDNHDFVVLLYRNVLHRAASDSEIAAWTQRLDDGFGRAQVVIGFSESPENKAKTEASLDAYMRQANPDWIDVLEGGAGDDRMNGGDGADVFVFRRGEGGSDRIYGFEPWDELQLSGFGYRTRADAMAHMVQSNGNVLFSDRGQTIAFLGTSLAEMRRVRYNLS
jgi:hypothetical protein